MNPDVTSICTLLGWESITASEAATAPLGEAEQQTQAKALLEKLTEPDLTLGILAIRLGVRPNKVVQLLPPNPPKVVTRVLVERGEKYVRGFIAAACRPQFRARTHELSDFGEMAVTAVVELSCPPPDNVEFFRDWSILVAHDPSLLPGALFRAYFSQAVALGVPAMGALCTLPKTAVVHGWLTRDEACALVWSGLGSATRPGERKAWIKALTSDLELSATELSAHAAQIASLPAGENAVVAHLILPLLRLKNVAERSTLVVNALYAPSKKQLKAVLDCVADQHVPEAVGRVQELAADVDSGVAACAQRVLEQWGVPGSTPYPDPSCPVGVWQPTPPVWEVPRFDVSGMTVDDLRHEWAIVYGGHHVRTLSLEAERVLCFTHRLAKSHKHVLRQVLSGTADELWPYNLVSWAQNDPPQQEEFTAFTLCDRNHLITSVLDDLPLLLSEPTWVDFRIHPRDLLDRLRHYEATQATIFPPDFFQALLRVDVSVVSPDKLLQLIDAATALTLTVTVAEDYVVSAGTVVAEYFQNPASENPCDIKPDVFNNLIPLSSPAFEDVVAYFGQELRCKPLPFYLPNFGDGVFRSLVWRNGKNPMMVAMAIECSRRAKPLSPRVAMNLLAVQRATAPETAQLLHKAVTNAWRRGLLIPGVADVDQLDWGAELSQIPPLVSALRGLADEGMLAVVWDVFDQLIGRIATMQRLPAGTLDIVAACEYYLPAVPNEARTLHGLRLFAQRAGKSEPVRLAQKVVAQLPTGGGVDKQEVGERFEQIWPTYAGTKPHADDGVRISSYTRTPTEEITLAVPGIEHPITVAECSPTTLNCLKQGRKGSLYTDSTQVLFSPWARKCTEKPDDDCPPFLSLVLLAQLGLGATDNPWRHYRNQLCGAATIRIFVEQLLHFPDFRPDMCLKAITGNLELLPWLWPVITVSLTHAAACTTPPVWAARVLAFACEHAPILAEATRRGHIPATEWDSLNTLAAMSKKCAAKTKAQQLRTFFNNQIGQPR